MQTTASASYIFSNHIEAADAIHSLNRSGFDVNKLSLIGKGYHSERNPIGFYTRGGQIKVWGRRGACWGGIWGLFLSSGVFYIPGIGLLVMAGPIVAMLVSNFDGAPVGGGITALGAAFSDFGATGHQAMQYESELKTDKYVLLVHGSTEDVAKLNYLLPMTRMQSLAS
ncbi:DUF1269 domain-containing protein [Herbaspirillum lusitanum]|uniref:DUF1269 domain-containing protein n=1 Tax=Herbaspirillum lusitanum TaxID=213312 RepID=A0ABW9A4W3_9BURK